VGDSGCKSPTFMFIGAVARFARLPRNCNFFPGVPLVPIDRDSLYPRLYADTRFAGFRKLASVFGSKIFEMP